MVKLSIIGLAGDSGCQVATLGLHEKLLEILNENELVFAPTLIDQKDIPITDVAIIEGGIRTKHEEELAKEIRKKSNIVITIGSCACFGGILGLANLEKGEDLLKRIYGDFEDIISGPIPEIDEVIPYVKPIDSVIKVNFMIPGCPPELDDIAYVITTLLKGETPILAKSDVCDDCPRERLNEYSKKIKRIHEEPPIPDRCLLEQGFLCMGPATRGGCGAPCPSAGNTCDGCRGPTEKNEDQGLTMLDALTSLIDVAEEGPYLSRDPGMIYRYTFANSRIAKILNRRQTK